MNNLCRANFLLIKHAGYAGICKRHRWMSTSVKTIDKILIANRGEIACRVIKTARLLGVKTVAVYSDADEKSMHVALADEGYNIGPPPATESYLCSNKILEVAKKAGCQAIHPGYGFLSENVEFAEECQKRDIIFIGPPSSAIKDMGIKSTSKSIMSAANVPIIHGYHGHDQQLSILKSQAEKIGYPIMIKAVRGGGGKGMRIATTESEFEEALSSAKRESLKAFGDDAVLLERFISEPRHVEVQVFADMHGNAVHFFERDCSVQRRHQKIIEEAPAPGLSKQLRSKLGDAAVRAAKAVGYVGAGTVEFILDRNTHDFFFMEMNTRLQVEHPVTEMITGIDLVELQLKVAAGERLPFSQEEINMKGHSFEARIYAEDPSGGFLPGAGPLSYLSTPTPAEDVRVETGVRQGDEVSVHYDPMIAKLVVWGKDRMEALVKLRAKLLEYNIAGLSTNVDFLQTLAKHHQFVAGNVHTNFIKDYHDDLFRDSPVKDYQLVHLSLAVVLTDSENIKTQSIKDKDQHNPFVLETGFRINYLYERELKMKHKSGDLKCVRIKFLPNREYLISLDEGVTWRKVKGEITKTDNRLVLSCNIEGEVTTSNVYRNERSVTVFSEDGKCEVQLETPKYLSLSSEEGQSETNQALSPMPGVVDKILVQNGAVVKKGDSLVVLIAMKMEYIVKAGKDAIVEEVLYTMGDSVAKDAVLVRFKEEPK